MLNEPSRPTLRFGSFHLDLSIGRAVGPRGIELDLRPKTFDFLKYLVENAGRLVSRDELMEAVWPGVIVSDDSITQCVTEIRRAIGDEGQRLLRTVPKRGYIFAADVLESTREGQQPRVSAGVSSQEDWPSTIFENVPPRDLNFTGREAVLAELHRLLTSGTGAAQVAVHGLGGVGKTSLATEYVYRCRAAYLGVWWAPAENRTVLVSSLSALAGRLEPRLVQEADQEKAARAGLAIIARSAKPFLLVYDNVETPEELRELLPPSGARSLLTTRWADWGGRAAELGLPALAAEAAAEFLQKRAARIDDAGAGRLVAALGHLPLALDHAGAYCRLTGMTFDAYRERIDRLVARPPKGAAYPASVGATFDLAIDRAAAECPAAETLLGFCAFLAPDRIPVELIAGEMPDEVERAEALLTLAAVSLIEHGEGENGEPALTIHRLVQTAMRRRLAEQGGTGVMIGRVLQQVADAFPKSAYRDASVWQRCAMLLPHVLEMRDRIEDGVSVGGLAVFLHAAGSYLHRRGAYSEAEPLLTRAIAIGEVTLGADHPNVGAACSSLARLYRDVGRYDEAEPLLKRAIQIGETALGPDHATVAARLVDLAHHLYDFGRHAEAEPIYKRAIAIGEAALGREHSLVAVAVGSLARLYRAAGRHTEAQPLFDRAIVAGMIALGREHPTVAAALADQLNGSDAPAGENPIGREHPDVAIQLNRLAYLHRAAGRYAEAEVLLKGALAISERALGREHLDIAISLNSLARLYRVAGRHAEAEPLLKEAVAISERIVGRIHPTVAIWLYNLGRLYRDTGRLVEAELVLREVVTISEQTVGPRNQGTARGRWVLADLLLALGRGADALEQASAAFLDHETILGAEHQWTFDSAKTLVSALRAVGHCDEAERIASRFSLRGEQDDPSTARA